MRKDKRNEAESEAQTPKCKPFIVPSEVSKIELAKALKTLRDILPLEVYEKVQHETLAAFPQTSEIELNRSITGLSAEDDFALMCRLMQTARHIVGLEQRPIVSPKPDIPDFLINFHYSCRAELNHNEKPEGYLYFVDVKHTELDKKKIGGDSLRRLRAFAKEINFPLLFALRFDTKGELSKWVIVEDTEAESSITIRRSTSDNIAHLLWADMGVVMPNYGLTWVLLCPKAHSSEHYSIKTLQMVICFTLNMEDYAV